MEKKSIRKINVNQFEKSPSLAEVKVSYKRKIDDTEKVFVSSSQTAFNVLFPLYDLDTIDYQEHFYLLLLNRSNVVIGWIKLSSGGTSGTIVDPKIVFALALKTNASAIILSHNHPSGSLNPSESDVKLTKRINDAGTFFEIKLLDHIIVTSNLTYYSFADEGKI
jgi:DNA repair protein RadC